ncbi:MAG: AIR synthase-related protein, partial [Acidobacteriota bacterium]|nr:AIR synthase-related protein [Acidobacteriota bacterium]
ERAVAVMTTLNKAAAEAIGAVTGGHACTDITGFGLLGHASEMAAASGQTLELDATVVPVIEGVLPLLPRHRSAGMATNRAHFGAGIHFGPAVDRTLQDVLFDPQTSGGLLVSVDPSRADALTSALHNARIAALAVGRVVPRTDGRLVSVF